jgi:hypothetical protein
MNENQNTRQESLVRVITRLESRLVRLEARGKKFVWYRLATFSLGFCATLLAITALNSKDAWLVFLGSVVIFSLVVRLHRILDKGIIRHTIWLKLRQTQFARLTLDWENLPLPASSPMNRSPLDIDLDLTGLHSLHQLVDLAISMEGSQLLAQWLTNPVPNPDEIFARQRVVRDLADHPRFFERLLLNMQMVSGQQLHGANLLKWLHVTYPSQELRFRLTVAVCLTLFNGFLFILNISGVLPPYWIASLIVYGFFYFTNVGILAEFLEAVVALDRELDRFQPILHQLETYPLDEKTALASFCSPFRNPEKLPSKRIMRLKWITAAIGLRSNPILGLLINIVLPWDFLFAFLADRERADASIDFPIWLDSWYRLEAMSSLANLSYLNTNYSFPEINPTSTHVFLAKGLGHPLIPPNAKVCNDFALPELGQVMIITGSNMSGKSTLLKTIGVNLCLAFAGGPVNATILRTLPFRLHTCMRISDSITDGFSYFYAEVKCLRGLLESLYANETIPLLYLIDEIFRGTNNREREIGSQAFVQALINRKGIGLIATHDLGLASLAQFSAAVQNYHFRDTVIERQLHFDYKIYPGPCLTSNALKIMALEGLPVDQIK